MLLSRHSVAAAAFVLVSCTFAEPAPESLSGADLHCPVGTKLCDHQCVHVDQPSTGCESSSCEPCAPSHASAVCANGGCAIGVCATGWADCDRDPSNGCEEEDSLCSCHSVVFATPTAEASIAHEGMDLGESDWTWEGWLEFEEGKSNLVFTMNDTANEEGYIFVETGDHIVCGVYVPGSQIWGRNVLADMTPMLRGQWQHVACQRRDSELKMFLNGYVRVTGTIEVPAHGVSNAALKRDFSSAARLGPMRLSKVARYDKEFVPRTRWAPDQDTVLQYLVKSGITAGTFVDEAGGENVGQILGGIEDGKDDTPCAVFGY
jgi:hypothetical protein